MSLLKVKVALVGNPNTGKSTLFNALSGLRQQVGNYPGVTVEMKKGRFVHGTTEFELIDLPGTYSLAPRSPDEMVAVDLLLGRRADESKPDLILSIVDASNLERHLYLTTQLMELGVPVVLAVNMVDVAANQGVKLDLGLLAKQVGLPVVAVQANQGVGLVALKDELARSVGTAAPSAPPLPDAVVREAAIFSEQYGDELPPFLARRLLFDIDGYAEQWLIAKHGPGLKQDVQAARERLANEGCSVPGVEAKTRYGWIRQVVAKAVTKPTNKPITWSDRIDRILTHKVWGTLIFLTIMFFVFQSIFVWAKPLMDLIDTLRNLAAEAVTNHMPTGPLQAVIVDGIIKGVGSVLVFLPQIVILFGFIAVLEDCGYMSRAAFLMDKIMSRCGLNGKSFIPLLSSVACAVPGIMATRVIENRRDRLATIMVAPLMSCSARLPVYALFIGAFLKDGFPWWLPGMTLFGMYLIGFVTAPLVALLLKRTLLRGDTPLFVMELPAYKRPSIRTILLRMLDAGTAFVRRAGTLIFASMIVVWATLYFPISDGNGGNYPDAVANQAAQVSTLDNEIAVLKAKNEPVEELVAKRDAVEQEKDRLNGEWKRNSVLGRTGQTLEPVFRPLGWDWKIGMAVIASFPAREVIVGTFGIIYDLGEVDSKTIDDANDEKASGLKAALKNEWRDDAVRGKYAVPVALSVMVFFALCCQCASTLAVIKRETRSWAWPIFTFFYMTILAYFAAMFTFQIGRLITNAVS